MLSRGFCFFCSINTIWSGRSNFWLVNIVAGSWRDKIKTKEQLTSIRQGVDTRRFPSHWIFLSTVKSIKKWKYGTAVNLSITDLPQKLKMETTEEHHQETALKELQSSVAETGETVNTMLLSGFFTSYSFMGEWQWEFTVKIMSADISSTVSPEGMWETSWRKILWKPDQTKIELFGHRYERQTLHIIRNTTSSQWSMVVNAFLQKGLEGLLG